MAIRTKRWTRLEYERLIHLGAFGPNDRLELLGGQLVVEVALSSLAINRGEKASLYARAGLADYWIVNLVDNVLEVYRDPERDPGAPYGWRYRSVARSEPETR